MDRPCREDREMSGTRSAYNPGDYCAVLARMQGFDGVQPPVAEFVLGKDDYGCDLKVFGATSGKYMLWDESADLLDVQGKARVGTHDWGVGATGVLLNGTDPGMVFQVAGRINAALADGPYAAAYHQLACTAAQTGNVSVFASWNELYFTGTTALVSNAAAVWGHIEISGTFTGPGSTSAYMGSVVGTLMSDADTVTNEGIMGAFVADSVLTSGFTNNGKIAAFVAHVNASHPTRANWPMALYVDGCDVVIGFGSGTNYEDGIKITATVAGNAEHDVNADGLLKLDVDGTAYYIPIFTAAKVTNE